MHQATAAAQGPLVMPHKDEPVHPKYCEQIYRTVRRPTRTVSIGKVLVGSQHPIALQTMTTTDTRDVMGTVTQVSLSPPQHAWCG